MFNSIETANFMQQQVSATAHNLNMDHDPNEICYLCSKRLGDVGVNFDHIFQQQFIKRDQPVAKGFDYGGVLPVHRACNDKFGTGMYAPESICRKALQLLEVLNGNNAMVNEQSKIIAINSSVLPEFTENDFRFFKLIDVRNLPNEVALSNEYLADKPKVNPFALSANVALTTLAKSAAGFLVKRRNYLPEVRWRILATPYIGQDDNFDLDHLFGGVKPLEMGIKLWIKPEAGGWFLAYKHKRVLVFLAIESNATSLFSLVTNAFQNADCLFYDSQSLIDLVGYDWSRNKYRL